LDGPSVITITDSNELVASMHDRVPVILAFHLQGDQRVREIMEFSILK